MLFEKAKIEAACLKMGFYGPNGSGKTYTASKVAIGLAKHIKAKKPCYFFDTETGSDFVLHLFKDAGVELVVAKRRSFGDLLDATKEAIENSSVFLIDSVTHVWDELIESYKEEKKLSRLFVQHWMDIKPMWREFSELFVSAPIHVIVCGRAGDVWEEEIDETGAKELKKTGTRMRTEKELGYEPSLLVEMEIKRPTPKKWLHQAWVAKDRFDLLNFQTFEDPGFEEFLPHIKALNLGGVHKAFDKSDNTKKLFSNDKTGLALAKKREALLDEIKSEITYQFPGQDQVSKKAKADIIKEIFDTRSWVKVEQIWEIETLENGLAAIKGKFEKEDSHATA